LKQLKTIHALLQFALAHGFCTQDPTQGLKLPSIKTKGYYTWADEEIAIFEAHHPIGTKPRLALALLLYTAQRRGDVLRMGRQHIRDGVLTVRQDKTGAVLAIPVHSDLQFILDATRTAGRISATSFANGATLPGYRSNARRTGYAKPRVDGWRKPGARPMRSRPSVDTPACGKLSATPRPSTKPAWRATPWRGGDSELTNPSWLRSRSGIRDIPRVGSVHGWPTCCLASTEALTRSTDPLLAVHERLQVGHHHQENKGLPECAVHRS
jgi:hypothetical protein